MSYRRIVVSSYRRIVVSSYRRMPLPVLDFVIADLDEGIAQAYPLERLAEVESIVKSHLEGDCHAVLMNSEVVFDMYRVADMTFRERVQEYAIREHLFSDPHRHIFVPLLRTHEVFTIEVWMFSVANGVWKLVVEFDTENCVFTLRVEEST